MFTKKLVIAAGGSGGHIYPAMGMAVKLKDSISNLEVLFVAGGLLESPFFNSNIFKGESISSAMLTKNPIRLIENAATIVKGIWQSRQLLSTFKPDLVIGFGSYHTFPILAAARLQKYPIVLHEQNSKPGKVIRLFSKKAVATGVYFPTVVERLKGNVELMAMPLRAGFAKNLCTNKQAAEYFGLEGNAFTLLVFGGSQGAQFINQTISQELVRALQGKEIEILHFTGNESETKRLKVFYGTKGFKAIVRTFEDRMDLAWRLADLAIVRAGAGTIAEQIEFEVPAIFIPFPFSADGHQESNADFVVNQIGGGWKFQELTWNTNQFSVILRHLLNKNNLLLEEAQHRIRIYKEKASRKEFTCLIRDLLNV